MQSLVVGLALVGEDRDAVAQSKRAERLYYTQLSVPAHEQVLHLCQSLGVRPSCHKPHSTDTDDLYHGDENQLVAQSQTGLNADNDE